MPTTRRPAPRRRSRSRWPSATSTTTLSAAAFGEGTILTANVVVTSPRGIRRSSARSPSTTARLSSGPEPVANGVATLDAKSLTAGMHTFSTVFTGDGTTSTSQTSLAISTANPTVTRVVRYGFHHPADVPGVVLQRCARSGHGGGRVELLPLRPDRWGGRPPLCGLHPIGYLRCVVEYRDPGDRRTVEHPLEMAAHGQRHVAGRGAGRLRPQCWTGRHTARPPSTTTAGRN